MKVNSERDNYYVNINLNNIEGGTNNTFGSQQASFESNNTNPILDKSSDYYCSVLRFDIPLNAIPILIMPIQPLPNTNVNLSTLVIGINYSGNNYPTSLIYTSEHFNIQAPLTNTDPLSVYYWVYSYGHFITMLNTALETSWVNSGLSVAYPSFDSPYFIYDAPTGLISLIVPNIFTGSSHPIIYMNTALIKYLDGWYTNTWGANSPNSRDYDFVTDSQIKPYYFNGPTTTTTGSSTSWDAPLYYQFQQEYNTLGYWSVLRKILITTNTIPIAYEWTTSNDTQATRFPVLTDFVPIVEKNGQSRSIAYYLPSSQYRLVDLISDAPLQKLDLKFFWESIDGDTFPLLLTPRQQLNLKLGFFKKSLYKNKNLLLK